MNVTMAFLGIFMAAICVCRMNALDYKRHRLKTRIKYLALFGGSIAAAGDPLLFPSMPGMGHVVLMLSVIVGALCSTWDWRDGPPPYHFNPRQEVIRETFSGTMDRRAGGLRGKTQRAIHMAVDLFRHALR